MEKVELLDKLKRAYEMEEVMNSELMRLCDMEVLPEDLPGGVRVIIHNILIGMKADTLRHKGIVSKIRDNL